MPFKIVVVAVAAVAAVAVLGARAEAKLRVVASIETLADLSRQVGRRPGRRHVAVARLPGSALRRGEAVAGAGAQPRRRAGLRRPRPGDRLAAAAGAAGAQRAHPARPARATSTRRRRSAPKTSPNVPSDQLRAMGDIHPLGNPHYWIPPKNARAIARLLAAAARPRSTRRARPRIRRELAQLRGAPGRQGEGMGGRGGAAAGHAHRHVPQELVVRRALAGAGGGRLHRAQARHPADRQPHRAARRADEEVGRASWSSSNRSTRARWRASSPTTAAPAWSARRPTSAPTPAIKTYFDLVDAVVAALQAAGDRAQTARARASTCTAAAPAASSASLHSLNVAPVV